MRFSYLPVIASKLMDNILDLRDIKRPPKTNTPPVSSASPVAPSETAERGQFTREQVDATRLIYFFQRENGEVFSTSAVDAWNQMEYMKNQRSNPLKFIGTSDGSVRRAVMQEKGKLVDSLKKKIISLGSRSMALNNEEGALLGEMETPKIKARLAQIANEQSFVASEQERVSLKLDGIEKEIFNAEVDDARRRGGKIPNFSGGGDPKAVALYESSDIFKKN